MKIYILITILLLAGFAKAATLTVCPSGCDYTNPRSAVDAASPSDAIEIYSGDYDKAVMTKSLTIRGGHLGPDGSIIETGDEPPTIGILYQCHHSLAMDIRWLKVIEKRDDCPPGVVSAQGSSPEVAFILTSSGENILVSVVPSAGSPSDLGDYNVTLVDCNENRLGPHNTDINGKTSFGMTGCPCDITASKMESTPNGQRLCYYGQMHVEHNPGYIQISVDKMCDYSTQNCTCCTDDITSIQKVQATTDQKLLFSDDFSSNKSGFSTTSDHPKNYTVGYEDGKYHITDLRENDVASSWLTRSFSDFVMEVEATQEGGPDDNDYGVILRRVDQDNYYRFKISGTGDYGFDKWEDSGWIDIIPWTRSNAINTGEATNVIKVECNGDKFTFYVNDIKLGDCTDNSFASGKIGLEAGTYDTANVHVSFDNFKVWAIDDDHESSKPLVADQPSPSVAKESNAQFLDDPGQGASATVCRSGCKYTSIQAAINAASSGDVIKVSSGTYTENLVLTKNVSVEGVVTGGGKPIISGDIDTNGNPLSFSYCVLTGTIKFRGNVAIVGCHDAEFNGPTIIM